MARNTWLCRCGHRNEKVWTKCRGEGCGRTKPKRRAPAHEHALTEYTHDFYDSLNVDVHGVDPDQCAICEKRVKGQRPDRDHAHYDGGFPRGRLCWYCNKRLGEIERGQDGLVWMDAASRYLERARNAHLARQEEAA